MNPDNQKLPREQILRGYGAFSKVLNNSVPVSSEYIKAFLSNYRFYSNDTNPRPLENNLKVGFIISKKRVRKAADRNYLRRLLKEGFRLKRDIYLKDYAAKNIKMILTLTEKGFAAAANGKIDHSLVLKETDRLLSHIKILLEKKK